MDILVRTKIESIQRPYRRIIPPVPSKGPIPIDPHLQTLSAGRSQSLQDVDQAVGINGIAWDTPPEN